MKNRIILGVVLVVFVFAGLISADDNSAVKEAFQKYVDDWSKGDLEGVFAFIAEDFVQMPPYEGPFIGKKAIVADWKKYMKEYSSLWEPTLKDIAISGELAYLRGFFVETRTPKAGGDATTQKGYSVWVLRQNSDGEWKLILELWFGEGWE